MPPRPVVPGVAQVTWGGTLSGTQRWLNKLFVEYLGSAPTIAELDTYADNVLTSLTTNLTPLQPAATVIDNVTVLDLASVLGSEGSSITPVPGTRAGVDIPGSACALISHRVTRHYRGGHPRTYLPVGVAGDLLTQSTWAAAFVTAVNAAVQAVFLEMLVPVTGFAPTGHCSVSYFGGAPPVDEASVPRLVPIIDPYLATNSLCSAKLATQRRRLGRG
jgi:hypothetical protein